MKLDLIGGQNSKESTFKNVCYYAASLARTQPSPVGISR